MAKTIEDFRKTIGEKMRLKSSDLKAFYKVKRPAPPPSKAGQKAAAATTLNLPKGYVENFYRWDRKEDTLLVLFVATNDDLGIFIDGLRYGDRISIESASGTASFSTEYDWGNILGASITAVLGRGAEILDKTFTAGQFSGLIKDGEKFMQDQFKDKKKPGKVRDAFGVDPGSQHKAKQEGGVLVCLPGNFGASYSSNNRDYWIKEPGDRYDIAVPPQVQDGFFVRRNANHNTRYIRQQQKGQVVILAWDHKFKDNVGYYKMAVRLIKGNGTIPQGPVD